MTVRFRNLRISPDAPVADWPYEGLVEAVQRGSLSDWRRVAAAVRAEPWGRVARGLEQYAGYAEPSGALDLLLRPVQRAREAAESHETACVAAEVRDLVARSGLSRAAFASATGTSPSRLSTYCTGTVVPSAALLVRMRGVVSRAGRGG